MLVLVGATLPIGVATAAAGSTGAAVVTAATTGASLLREGSTGPAVADWQQQLNAASGAGLVVDGVFGPRTDQATRAFQAGRHIVVDGIVGPQTRAAMAEALGGEGATLLPGPQGLLEVGSTGPAVADWQQQLNAASGAGLVVDGVFGPRTDQATRAFQAGRHIVVDGIVGPQTRAAMAQALTGQATTPNASPTTVLSCSGGHLAVAAGEGTAGLGHEGVVLLFRNVGSTVCALHGYPGVAGLNSGGRQVTQARRTPSGYLGGLAFGQTTPPNVVLAPGQTASALVEGTDVPMGNEMSCPSYPSLLVTPPNTTSSVPVSASLPGCSGLAIHPVVPGTGGSEPSS